MGLDVLYLVAWESWSTWDYLSAISGAPLHIADELCQDTTDEKSLHDEAATRREDSVMLRWLFVISMAYLCMAASCIPVLLQRLASTENGGRRSRLLK